MLEDLPHGGHKRAGCHHSEVERLSAMSLKEAQQPRAKTGTPGACWRSCTAQRAKCPKEMTLAPGLREQHVSRELYKALKGPVVLSVLTPPFQAPPPKQTGSASSKGTDP